MHMYWQTALTRIMSSVHYIAISDLIDSSQIFFYQVRQEYPKAAQDEAGGTGSHNGRLCGCLLVPRVRIRR